MLRPQLTCSVLFILAVAGHAITPIHPLPEKSVAGKIETAELITPGHINSIPAPVAVVNAEPATPSTFDLLVAGAVSEMQQKADAAKIALSPEIEKLKEQEQVFKHEIQELQAQAVVKLQPELDKLNAEQSKLRAAVAAEVEKHMPTQQQLDELRREADAAASSIGREIDSMKATPYAVQIKEAVAKVTNDLSNRAEDAKLPHRIEAAKTSVAVAQQALQDDLKAELEHLKPVADKIGKEIEEKKELFKDFLHRQQERFENEAPEMKPWDSLESEVLSDMENMGRLINDRMQSDQSPLGVQPPLRGSRVMIFRRQLPGADEQPVPFMPPFLMQHGPVNGVGAVRIRLGVPIVGPEPFLPALAPEQKAGDDMEHHEEEEHHGHRHRHDHHGHGRGGKLHHLKHWLRTHFAMNRPEDMQAAEESQPQRGFVLQFHSGLDGQQAGAEGSDDATMRPEGDQQAEVEGNDDAIMRPDSFHDDRHHGHHHGKRFARCFFHIVMPIIFVVAAGLLMRRCIRCCDGRQRTADVRVVGGVVMRGQQQQQQQQPYFHINHPFHHQYQHPQQQQSFYPSPPPPPPPPQHSHYAHAPSSPNPYPDNSWAAARSAAPLPAPRVVGATFPHFPSVFAGATAPPQGDGIEMRSLH